ncbi:MAG: alpha/beta hydrolase [Bryobacteraceae bacterium]|nr:alpha/beta hydrolase [Bryobacteraceae bacterium]
MAHFCLVHGSAQGPHGWDLLVRELEALGHLCVCADLPVDQPEAGGMVYAAAIADAARGLSQPVVVAHSASGLFLPLAAPRIPGARLVYLAAVLPLPGMSFAEQFRQWPDMYIPGFAGRNPVVDQSLARDFLFHDASPEVAEWAFSTVRLMYAKTAIAEITPMREWPGVSSAYVSCTQERTINPAWWERAARERLGVEPLRMEAGHAPFVSRPAELAQLLSGIWG